MRRVDGIQGIAWAADILLGNKAYTEQSKARAAGWQGL